jgi:cytochrome c553
MISKVSLVSTAFSAFLALMSVSPIAAAQDVAAGQAKAAMCIGCHGIHGYQASFPEVHKVPMISGQTGKYIVAALNAYKKGDRKHPTMRSISVTLTDKDMADLAAFYEGQRPSSLKAVADTPAVQPSAEVAALLTKGACASCHGANYNKPIDGTYPKLAGQHADYLFVALKSYRVESNPQIGRNNAIMGAQVKPFTNNELRAMAKYLASLPGDLSVVPQSKFR